LEITVSDVVLTINGGSSSIKFAAFLVNGSPERIWEGKLERIGLPGEKLTFREKGETARTIEPPGEGLVEWLSRREDFQLVRAIGHRIVHGMRMTEPAAVTDELIAELRRIAAVDPDHLPGEIALMEAFRARHPRLPQIACFDTEFHGTMPRVAKLLPIPRRFDAAGVQRYGFHGLSYAYLMEELERVAGGKAARSRVILAHLGNGASMAAVSNGQCVDTTMGFTPAGGMPMGTRPRDLDPGIAAYLMEVEGMTPAQYNEMIHRGSGLRGVSETSPDMRDLVARRKEDARAFEAVELFCYSAKKWIGAFAAALGGLDTLVFSGGIGENIPEVRSEICAGLGFLGIELDEQRNATGASVISAKQSRCVVRVIRTDEEIMIARELCKLLEPKLVS
jgi:acetate kinase